MWVWKIQYRHLCRRNNVEKCWKMLKNVKTDPLCFEVFTDHGGSGAYFSWSDFLVLVGHWIVFLSRQSFWSDPEEDQNGPSLSLRAWTKQAASKLDESFCRLPERSLQQLPNTSFSTVWFSLAQNHSRVSSGGPSGLLWRLILWFPICFVFFAVVLIGPVGSPGCLV